MTKPKLIAGLKRRAIFIALICSAALIFTFSLIAINNKTNQTIAQQQKKAETSIAESKKELIAIKKKKAKEERARAKREEAKKKAEAARKQAEASKANQAPTTATTTSKKCSSTGPHFNPSRIDVLVNKKHCINPINFTPGDLTTYQGYYISAKIKPQLEAMLAAAAKAGYSISISSAYRSYSTQVSTYNYWVKVNGSYASADTISARPGYSEHQTGFTLDLKTGGCSLDCFNGTKHYIWLRDNAYKYGFIQRYIAGQEAITGYSAEPWHWRYVGVPTATAIHQSGTKTLEQFWGIAGGGY